uniref:Uncharacterized protein n=1 Tax=Cucumis melo TaxID=3656 RepID=A0A9I9E302_CUCME
MNPYDDVVYHTDSLRISSRDDIKYGLDDFPISKEFEKDQKNNILESDKGKYTLQEIWPLMSLGDRHISERY